MQWSMPHRVLQVVALLLILTAATSFALGVARAPGPGRMPGETAGGAKVAPIQAVEAVPLSQERIEGPPPPPQPTPEELAQQQAAAKAKADAEAAAKLAEVQAEAAKAPPVAVPAPEKPQPDRVGEILDKAAQAPPPPPKGELPPF